MNISRKRSAVINEAHSREAPFLRYQDALSNPWWPEASSPQSMSHVSCASGENGLGSEYESILPISSNFLQGFASGDIHSVQASQQAAATTGTSQEPKSHPPLPRDPRWPMQKRTLITSPKVAHRTMNGQVSRPSAAACPQAANSRTHSGTRRLFRNRAPHYNQTSLATPKSSLYGLNDQLALNSTKSGIANFFARIYMDSLEHLLSCWAADSACPYIMSTKSFRSQKTPHLIQEPNPFGRPQVRFHELVRHLDSKLLPLRGSMNATEATTARKALQKTVMAFASQWPSYIHSDCLVQIPTGTTSEASSLEWRSGDNADTNSLRQGSQEQHRILQESLWHDARKDIQASSGFYSFSAIFAHIIFSMIQPPPSVVPPGNATFAAAANKRGIYRPSSLLQSNDCTIYLDIALRHLYSWNRTITRLHTGGADTTTGTSTVNLPELTEGDKDAFSLVYWLGIMCDTTSAALNNRPVTIVDEDCTVLLKFEDIILPSQTMSSVERPTNDRMPLSQSYHTHLSDMWRLELFQRRAQDHAKIGLHWPCSLADAAIILRDSCPIKVLLFRHVTYLQSMTCRQTLPNQVEDTIERALEIRRSWDATYGCFINDCMQDHHNLPARMQSWYILLGAHWSLGLLLMANAIEDIDSMGRQAVLQPRLGDQTSVIADLRISSAYKIAKLAQISCSASTSIPCHSIDHGFVFSDGAFITEPWTDILVRALAGAASVFLTLLDSECADNAALALIETEACLTAVNHINNAQDCISGLQKLASKSEMARQLSMELSSRLQPLLDVDNLNDHTTRYDGYVNEDIPPDGCSLFDDIENSDSDQADVLASLGLPTGYSGASVAGHTGLSNYIDNSADSTFSYTI